jgi:hypothetical protein
VSRVGKRVLALVVLSLLLSASAGVSASAAYDWQADPEFTLGEQLPPPPGAAHEVVFRVYDYSGRFVEEWDMPAQSLSDRIPLPPVPGIYTLEAWLENEADEDGAHATFAGIRFDNKTPPPPLAEADDWVMGADPAKIALAPPVGQLPLAGLAGYAVSTDRGTGSFPCSRQTRCDVTELDLRGAAGGSVSLSTLPEGVNFVRAVAVSGSGIASSPATVEVRVDGSVPRVSLQGALPGWSNRPVRLTAQASDDLSGMTAAGPDGPFTAIAVDGGPAIRAAGDTASATVAGSGIHEVEYFARDTAGNAADGAGGSPAPARATVRIDEDPPRLAFAAAQDPADPERIEAFVWDSLSGPSPERGWIAVRPAGSRTRFEQLPTQVQSGRLVAHWDSDSYPPGKYEFLASGFDLAGNGATGGERSRGGRMVLVNPLKSPAFLETSFQRRGLRLSGRLRTLAGAPVPGQEIAIVETFDPGAAPARRTTSVRTGGDGRFLIRLGPGPSREVLALFAGNRTLTRAAGEKVRVQPPAAVRLRASGSTARIGGPPVVFSGRVSSPGAARVAGLPVELQFRFRGSGWREFRTVETDARGRFRYSYRFSDDDSRGVRFQFRAYVKGREGWPYEPSVSRPVSVTGR